MPIDSSLFFLAFLPALLGLFTDSFCTAAWPLLAERFSRSVFLWEHRFQPHRVEQEKPDMVLYEAVERFQHVLFGFPDEIP